MVDTIEVIESGSGITLVEVGIQGPPGPAGSFAPVVMGTVSMASASDIAITLVASARYACSVTGLFNLVVGAGSTTVTITINGVGVTGLTDVAVTSVAQDVLATANNAIAVGDELGFTLSGGTSATDFKFTMELSTS